MYALLAILLLSPTLPVAEAAGLPQNICPTTLRRGVVAYDCSSSRLTASVQVRETGLDDVGYVSARVTYRVVDRRSGKVLRSGTETSSRGCERNHYDPVHDRPEIGKYFLSPRGNGSLFALVLSSDLVGFENRLWTNLPSVGRIEILACRKTR